MAHMNGLANTGDEALQSEDYVDLRTLIDDESIVEEIGIENGQNKEKNLSPKKKLPSPIKDLPKVEVDLLASCSPKTFLKPYRSNDVANELFQVTNTLRQAKYQDYDESLEFNDLFNTKGLDNNKLNKLVDELGFNSEEFDFELDDRLRTRFFKGRFNRSAVNTESKDDLDRELSKYLSSNSSKRPQNHNKENISPISDPLKSIKNKDNSSIKKSNKMFFKSPRRGTGNTNMGSIPTIKPLSNVTNVERNTIEDTQEKSEPSPKRLFTPNHRTAEAPLPNIKISKENKHIYLVDSLTGHVNDATQFGTELNAFNCEGFPLPLDANEVVQIPTNDDSKAKKSKMAIIKAVNSSINFKRTKDGSQGQALKMRRRSGAYNWDEFQQYQNSKDLNNVSGVLIVNQGPPMIPTLSKSSMKVHNDDHKDRQKRKVRWASTLEW